MTAGHPTADEERHTDLVSDSARSGLPLSRQALLDRIRKAALWMAFALALLLLAFDRYAAEIWPAPLAVLRAYALG